MEVNTTAISALDSPVGASSGHSVAFWLLLACFMFVVVSYCCGLQMLGFAATGVVQGSIAALWQSSIAIANGVGVVAGSLFALLQSIAMGGIWVLPFLLIGLAVVVAIGWGSQLVDWLKDFGPHLVEWLKDIGQWFHQNVNAAQIWKELSQWFHDQVHMGEWWTECVQWVKGGFHEIRPVNLCDGRKCLG